jgi:hypothetical protein
MRADLDRVRVWCEGRLGRRSHTDLGARHQTISDLAHVKAAELLDPDLNAAVPGRRLPVTITTSIDCHRVPPLSPVNQDCLSCTALRPPLRGRLAADSLIICCRQSLVAPMYACGSGILVSRDTHAPWTLRARRCRCAGRVPLHAVRILNPEDLSSQRVGNRHLPNWHLAKNAVDMPSGAASARQTTYTEAAQRVLLHPDASHRSSTYPSVLC